MDSIIYTCIDCNLPYCVTCSGGEDSCAVCRTGPRCDECAAEHQEWQHKVEDHADGE